MAKEPPEYDKDYLFEAFVSIMRFERGVWESTYRLFLVNPQNLVLSAVTRRDLLMLTAQNLFEYVERACCLTMLAGITAILDDVHFGNNPERANLVLRRAIDDLAPSAGTSARDAIEADFVRAKELAEPLRESRNKFGAHNDLMMNLELMKHEYFGANRPMKRPTVGEIEEIWGCFIRITDALVAHYRPGYAWYVSDIEVDKFFQVLERGLKAKPHEERQGEQ